MASLEAVRKDTHDTVVGRPFTRTPGLPTWEQKDKFLEEAEEMALEFTVNHEWAGKFGLLAEIIGPVKYLAKTEKVYVPPPRPPVVHPDVLAGHLTDKAARIATLNNDQLKLDYAIIQGFRSGFSVNFRNAFDNKYYEQLYEDTLKYKRITPRQFIEHLETRWVKQDIMIVKRLRAKFVCDTLVLITIKGLQQHYLEEVLKRSDLFGERCIT